MPHLWTVVITTVHNIMSSSSTGVSERHEEEPTANRTGFLPWENDLEMISKFLDRKEELEESHHHYIKQHPELRAILTDFVNALVIQKPDDVYKFAHDFFAPFSSKLPTPPPHLCHTTADCVD